MARLDSHDYRGGVGVSRFEPWLNDLVMRLRPARRRQAMRQLANGLRTRNMLRAMAQQNPDGSSWPQRSTGRWAMDRAKEEGRTGKMFKKLRTNMRGTYGTDYAKVGYRGGYMSWLVGVHQFGDTIDIGPHRKAHTFPIRALLGFSAEDRQWIENFFMDLIAKDATA